MLPAQRIIIVRLSALGDVVLAQAAVFALRRFAPKAEITWVIEERFRTIADAVPNIKVIPIEKPTSLSDYFRLRRLLRAESYDVLLAMQASFRVNLLYGAIRARRKIGFDPRRARDLQQVFVSEMIQPRDEHLLDGFLQFVAKAGVPAVKTPAWPPALGLAAEEKWWQAQLRSLPAFEAKVSAPEPKKDRSGAARYVALQVGASKPERCWPAEYYGKLGALLSARPDFNVVLVGGSSTEERAALAALRAAAPAALDLTGQTNLAQLQLILARAAVVISPDTAAVHIARAANVPVVGLYAVARPELSGPYRQLGYTVNRYPEAVREIAGRDPSDAKKVDWHFRVHDPRAMGLISVEDVWVAIERAWKAGS